jgi:hypothetical protein
MNLPNKIWKEKHWSEWVLSFSDTSGYDIKNHPNFDLGLRV